MARLQPRLKLEAEIAVLHSLGCKACPLAEHPGRMEPTGSVEPEVYMLGEAPGRNEIDQGRQFVGESGKLLRELIPQKYQHLLRWNNVVRSRPPQNRTPEWEEIECFPAGTLVKPIGKIKTLYRRWYEGPLTRVVTRDGNILTGTPNHPIFTGRGKIPFKAIEVGDQLKCTSLGDFGPPFWYPDGHNRPISINKIFDAFSKVAKLERMNTGTLDFHGDASFYGQVDVIRTDGLLFYDSKVWTDLTQQSKHSFFTSACFAFCTLMNFCCFDMRLFIKTMIAALLTFFKGMLLIPNVVSLRGAANFLPFKAQISSQAGCTDIFTWGDDFDAFALAIAADDICFRFPVAVSAAFLPPAIINSRATSQDNLIFEQEFSDSLGGSSSESSQLRNATSLQVQFDQVVAIETISNFGGHVYNLETESNQYIANNVLVSNCCRPSVVADIERSQPLTIFGFGNVPLTWISGFSGIMKWRGRRMPVQVGKHICWYYAFQHPASFLHQYYPTDDGYKSEGHRMLAFDLAQAFADLDMLLPVPKVHTAEQTRAGVECITKFFDIESALQWASRQSMVGVDYETTCLRPYAEDAAILSVAIGTPERTFAFPLGHSEAKYLPSEIYEIRDLWRRFLLTASCRKIVHNLAFEMEWSAYFFGSETLRAGKWEDTANAAAIVDERRGKLKPGCFSLEFLVQQYFGFNIKKLSNVDVEQLASTPLPTVLMYNGIDAKYNVLLWDKLWRIIERENLEEAYNLAVRRVPTVVLSQVKGAPVDQIRVKELDAKYGKLVAKAEANIAGLDVIKEFERIKEKPFNPSSSSRDSIYVFDKMLKRKEVFIYDKYAKEEKRSVKEEVLLQIRHPLARHLLALRSAAGTKSKYIDPLLASNEDTVVFPDGLIHTNFNTYFAETGRLSCVAPWTPVMTKQGLKAVCDIIVGDLVWTHCNRWCSVTALWRKGWEQMLRLTLSNGEILTCTKKHQLLLSSGEWVCVGELHERFQEMGEQQNSHHSGFIFVPWSRVNDYGTDSSETKHTYSKCMLDTQNSYVEAGTQGVGNVTVLCLETRQQEPNEGKISRATSQLEGTVRRSQRIQNDKNPISANVFAPSEFAEFVRDRTFTQRTADPSYRWKSAQQRHGQFGHCYSERSCNLTLAVPEGFKSVAIEKFEVGGSYEVFDITVEEDASYVTCGIFSHNSDSPNLQNFPKRDAETKEVRSSIVAPPGCVVLAFDYGQIEARVIAMFTKDKAFCKALWDRYDVHGDWAERIARDYPQRIGGEQNLTDKEAMKTFRTDIKNQWTFPLFFGAQLESAAGYLNIPISVLRKHYREFWKEFEGVALWQEQQIKFYREHGYTETLTGRRRRGPMTINQILNSPVQGTAAEIVLDAMSRLSETNDPELQPEIQVHDDFVFLRVPEERVDVIAEKIIDIMLAVPFDWVNVPISVEMSCGSNLADLKEVGMYASDTWRKV